MCYESAYGCGLAIKPLPLSQVRWSRKGYLLTRWKMFGSHIMNFSNIHLFHDDDNVMALEKVRHIKYMYSTYPSGTSFNSIASYSRSEQQQERESPILY